MALRHTTLPAISYMSTPTRPIKRMNDPINNNGILSFRAITTEMSTCGYAGGDINEPRTANEGFNCRVEITHGLWGFCPTTVIAARDCNLAGACVDRAACSTGCGALGESSVATRTRLSIAEQRRRQTFSWHLRPLLGTSVCKQQLIITKLPAL
ncbi:hypothetical protein BJ170DRAFT_617324 [Xylariales sp. AK1849]|nr:hypothetical protein BJ170DRAFT_617324 [Xylariales sp. AK1849]